MRRAWLRRWRHPRSALSEPWQRDLVVLWVVQLLSVAGFDSIMPFIPFYVQELGITEPRLVELWAGALASIPMAGAAIMSPVWGRMADRYGRKLMVLRATMAASLVIGAIGLVSAPWQLLVLRLFQGLTTGVLAATTVLVSSIVPRKQVGFALGLTQSSIYLGSTIIPPLSGWVVDHFGYRAAAFVGASLLLVAFLTALIGVKERFEPIPDEKRSEGQRQPSGLRSLLSHPVLLSLAITLLLVRLAQSFPQAVLPLFVQQLTTDASRLATVTGMVNSAASMTGALAAVVVGRLGDRLGHRRVLLYCLIGSALFYLPESMARSTTQLAMLQLGLGFFVGGAVLTLNALVARQSERGREGVNYGVMFSAGFVGLAVGPMIGSTIAATSSYRVSLAATAAVCVLAALLVERQTASKSRKRERPIMKDQPVVVRWNTYPLDLKDPMERFRRSQWNYFLADPEAKVLMGYWLAEEGYEDLGTDEFDEVLHVMEGSLHVTSDRQELVAGPGDTVLVRRGHHTRIAVHEPTRALFMCYPVDRPEAYEAKVRRAMADRGL
jgi:DHA1 family multidrug resistance protein-like MFS transporter